MATIPLHGPRPTFKPRAGSVIGSLDEVMGKTKARAARVVVWNNKTTLGIIPDARHPGHAAMQLFENGKLYRFVSWWPEGAVGKEDKRDARFGQGSSRLSMDVGSELGKYTREMLTSGEYRPQEGQYVYNKEWIKTPQDWVELPAMGTLGVVWGLNLRLIADWWDEWSKDQKYVMQSTTNNCSGAVSLALKEGGAESFVEGPTTWLVCSPNSIALWAHQLKKRLSALNVDANLLQVTLSKELKPEDSIWSLQIPTEREWMTATFLTMKPRSSLLKAIDSALAQFDQFREFKFIDRQKRLVKLSEAINDHLRESPNSERRNRVLSLAKAVLTDQKTRNRDAGPAPSERHKFEDPAPSERPKIEFVSDGSTGSPWLEDEVLY